MRFLHLSDTHFRKNYQTNQFTAPLFTEKDNPTTQLLNLLKESDLEEFDFVLITGDLVHEGEREDYQEFKNYLTDHLKTIPYFFCRGNHDRRKAFIEGMGVGTNEKNAYIACHDFDGLRIISLDSAQDTHHEGKISVEQTRQLQEWLQEPAEKGTILLLHHPLAWEEQEIATEVPDNFEAIIEQSDILGIFVGHIHQNSLATYGGKPQFMAEAVSFGVDEYPNEAIFTNRTGYSTFSLDNQKIYRYNHLLLPQQVRIGGVKKPIIGNH